MKISRTWLQKFFDAPLPDAQILADALTFHAFEIESVEGEILDVKVTPNRGHDCLSYRGIAKEVSAILNLQIKAHPYNVIDIALSPKTDAFSVSVEDAQLCPRFTASVIRGVKVGSSPAWLREALESMGQKSINNVVDATNYVMFDIGQPLHAFDAGKLTEKNGWKLTVRKARAGEKMFGLDDKEYALQDSILVIADGHTDEAVSIAGIKGGKPTGIDEKTVDIILEAANWDGPMIRKTTQALKLRTDASDRFQQVISPEFAAYGQKVAADLIVQIAGGEVLGFVDEYPHPQRPREISVTLERINSILGTTFSAEEVADVFKRLDMKTAASGTTYTVSIPFERIDLTIPEDLVEEVARIIGYDKVPPTPLPPLPQKPEVNELYAGAEAVREKFMSEGYSEVLTSVFADEGERVVANKVDAVRPHLRSSLIPGLEDALTRNVRNKDLLGLSKVKIFEIGNVWKDGQEMTMVGTIAEKEKGTEKPFEPLKTDHYEELPISTTEGYCTFSRYPSITRDIAMWTPAGTDPESVLALIRQNAGELLVRSSLFDRFEKGEKLSLAFRLVFQSFDRTLTDEDANVRMESVSATLKEKGFEIR